MAHGIPPVILALVRLAIGLVIVAVLWEFAAMFDTAPVRLPRLEAVFRKLSELLGNVDFQQNLSVTYLNFATGFLAACVIGIGLGLLAGFLQRALRLDFAVTPVLSALSAAPLIALIPAFFLRFGIQQTTYICVVFAVSVFPIASAVASGIGRGRRYGEVPPLPGRHGPHLGRVIVPALRLGAGFGLAGIVASELFGAKAGLGFVLLDSVSKFDLPRLFATILVFIVPGAIFITLLDGIGAQLADASERRF